MSKQLYRQEALDHIARRLYGKVVLQSPPPVLWLTFLVVITSGLIIAGLFLGHVQTETGPQTVFRWLSSRIG